MIRSVINKKVRFVVLLLLSILFVRCDKEFHDQIIPIIENMPVYYCNNKENKLIEDHEIVNKILVLNSREDVENNFTKAFLNLYPQYLQVDYDKHSVLVRTAPVDYEIISRNIYLLFQTDNKYRYNIDYTVGAILNVENYYIERTAIVVNKIPLDSNIEVTYGINKR